MLRHTHSSTHRKSIKQNQRTYCVSKTPGKSARSTVWRKRNTTKQKSSKYNWANFVLAICCWAWSLPLSVVGMPSETPMETANFFFMTYYLLTISSGSGMEACVHFYSVLEPHLTQTWTGPVHTPTISVTTFVCQSCSL